MRSVVLLRLPWRSRRGSKVSFSVPDDEWVSRDPVKADTKSLLCQVSASVNDTLDYGRMFGDTVETVDELR